MIGYLIGYRLDQVKIIDVNIKSKALIVRMVHISFKGIWYDKLKEN